MRHVVADEPFVEIELGLLEHLALAFDRAAGDQLDRSLVRRRAQDLVEAGFELVSGQVLYDLGHELSIADGAGHTETLMRTNLAPAALDQLDPVAVTFPDA